MNLGEDIKWYVPPTNRCYTHHEPGCGNCYLRFLLLDFERLKHKPERDGPLPHWYDELMERQKVVDDEVKKLIAKRIVDEKMRHDKLAPSLEAARADQAARRASRDGRSPVERFEDSIVKRDGHWLWQGGVNSFNRPILLLGSSYGNRMIASTWAYKRWVGSIPSKHRLAGTCEEEFCVHPDHWEPRPFGWSKKPHTTRVVESTLSTKTGRRMAAGLMPVGHTNDHGLSSDDIVYIKSKYAEGEISYKALAEKMNVQWKVVSAIVLKRPYKHL